MLYLFRPALLTQTSVNEIFKESYDYFSAVYWRFRSDGARVITGRKHEGQIRFCPSPQRSVSKAYVPKQFHQVLGQTLKMVNFIKLRALQTRLFLKSCSEMESDHIWLFAEFG